MTAGPAGEGGSTGGPAPLGAAGPLADAAPAALSRPQLLYLWLVGIATTSLLIADLVGVKVFQLPLPFHVPGLGTSIVHTCGMLTFPITFLLTDLVTEYYGRRAARRMTFVAFAMALFAFVVMSISLAIPRFPADWNVSEAGFAEVFGNARLMYLASLTAYLVGQLIDVTTFGAIKRATGGRWLWLRATGSTVISQAVDSLVVSFLYLKGKSLTSGDPAPLAAVLDFAVTGYTLKFLLALAVTPLIYAGHHLIERHVGLKPLPPGSTA